MPSPKLRQTLSMTSLVTLILLTYLPANCLTDGCPSNCNCENVQHPVCSGVSSIPNFTTKSSIKELEIKKHNITKLSKGGFADFTALAQLDITDGSLIEIEAGAFDGLSDTITKIDLSNNEIKELSNGTFVNMNKLNKLILDDNKLTVIKAETFVNLPKLDTLDIQINMITSIEKGSFVNLTDLSTLSLFHNSLVKIPFESLKGLDALKDIRLTHNNINEIPETSPVYLPALEDFSLDSNPIYSFKTFPNISSKLRILNFGFIHAQNYNKDTWKNLPNLEILIVNGMKIQHIKAGMFEGLNKLETLDIMSSQLLKTIGPDAFRGLPNLSHVNLKRNKQLVSIDESAFISNPNMIYLYIDNTSITYIPQKLVNWSKLKTLTLRGNPIKCDCKMAWVLDNANFGKNENSWKELQNMICAYPDSLKGRKIGSLSHDQLTCVSLAEDHKSRVVTGVIVAVVCLVFMAIVAVVTMNRKKISLWCRRYYQYRRYKNDMVFTVEQDTSVAELEDTVETRPLKDIRLETVPL